MSRIECVRWSDNGQTHKLACFLLRRACSLLQLPFRTTTAAPLGAAPTRSPAPVSVAPGPRFPRPPRLVPDPVPPHPVFPVQRSLTQLASPAPAPAGSARDHI